MNALLLTAVLATAAGGDDPLVREVRQALDTLNAAFEKGDAAALRAGMTDDHVAVTTYYNGPQTRDEQLAGLRDQKLTEYRAGKLTIAPLGTDTVLVTYALTLRGTYRGKELPRDSFATAVWVRRDGRWRERFYQETPLPGR